MLDLADRQVQLVRVVQRSTAVLPAVVGEEVFDLDAVLLVERQHAVVEDVDGRHRQLREVELAEGQRAVGVDDRLHVDPADTLDRPDEVRVLADQIAGRGAFDVPLGVADSRPLEAAQQLHLRFGQHASVGRRLLLEPEQAVVSEASARAEATRT